MNKRLEKLEWQQRMLEVETSLLQTQISTAALAAEIAAINQRDRDNEFWAELSKKQDMILRLNREALAK